MEIGSLIQYYDDGWRYGHLVEVAGKRARVRPIRAFKAGTPRCVWAQLTDVRESEIKVTKEETCLRKRR